MFGLMALGLIAGGLLAVLACSGTPGETGSAGSSSGGGRPELELGRSAEYDYDPPEPGSYELPVFMDAADGRVLDRQGQSHSLNELFENRVTVLSFIYTRCNDPTACPMATGVLRQVHRISKESPDIAGKMRLMTFSFDPAYDDPEAMARYGRSLGKFDGGAEWLFLTTADADAMRPILEGYGLFVDAKKDPNDPLGPLNHNLRVYLVDGQGRVRNIYSAGLLDPRLVVTDVRTLILEGRS